MIIQYVYNQNTIYTVNVYKNREIYLVKSILEELYYAGEGLVGKMGVSEEYNKIFSEYDKLYEQLLEGLNEEQKKMLDELSMLSGGMEGETGVTRFKAGFKLCMRLVLEGISK